MLLQSVEIGPRKRVVAMARFGGMLLSTRAVLRRRPIQGGIVRQSVRMRKVLRGKQFPALAALELAGKRSLSQRF